MSAITPFVAGAPPVAATARRAGAHAFGPLAPLVGDPRVTDVFVNGGEVWADRGRGPERLPASGMDAEAARALAVRLIGLAGRHVDEAAPCVDARLGDGVRGDRQRLAGRGAGGAAVERDLEEAIALQRLGLLVEALGQRVAHRLLGGGDGVGLALAGGAEAREEIIGRHGCVHSASAAPRETASCRCALSPGVDPCRAGG